MVRNRNEKIRSIFTRQIHAPRNLTFNIIRVKAQKFGIVDAKKKGGRFDALLDDVRVFDRRYREHALNGADSKRVAESLSNDPRTRIFKMVLSHEYFELI